jgi:hypothetical protein
MINKILDELKTKHQLSDNMLKTFDFEIKGDRIFIMSKQVKQFDRIKTVRKGILFAEKIGIAFKISDKIRFLVD